MIVIGISAYFHDSAVALLRDGIIVAAAQEERFTRRKHDAGFPSHALRFCVEQAGIEACDIDFVVFYDKPLLKFERLVETYLAFAPRGFGSFRVALPLWLRDKLHLKNLLKRNLCAMFGDIDWRGKLLFSEHHQSHAASAFYPSPFDAAAILTLDGVGEWATSSLAVGHGSRLEIHKEIHFPHSLGLLYSAFAQYLGFRVNSGEYKVMGLAPYGEPRYVNEIYGRLIDVKPDGSFRLNQDYFNYCTGLTMTNRRFASLFGGEARKPEEPLTQKHMDLAASVQVVTEEILLRLARAAAAATGMKNLCLAGGVALNCVANGKLLRDGAFEHLWIQPAAGDAGGALGAAYSAYHGFLDQPRLVTEGDAMQGAYLGPSFPQADIETRLRRLGAIFETLDDRTLLSVCARDLAAGKVLGWFQGRMEFGPRALGGRSILADARLPAMQSLLNAVKHREPFRPFGPSVLREDLAEWFDLDADSPYMSLVADVRRERRVPEAEEHKNLGGIGKLGVLRSEIPAVTHVDYSARIQTVHAETNARYHALLLEFKHLTGCAVVVNTSFNVRDEPIVCSPEDAFRCFMSTGIDALAIGNSYLHKDAQNQSP